MSPAAVNCSTSFCGFSGRLSTATPVALSTALRMAGAGGMAGGSPSDLFPYGPLGSIVSTKPTFSSGVSIAVGSL